MIFTLISIFICWNIFISNYKLICFNKVWNTYYYILFRNNRPILITNNFYIIIIILNILIITFINIVSFFNFTKFLHFLLTIFNIYVYIKIKNLNDTKI